jgi:hypothetical protein
MAAASPLTVNVVMRTVSSTPCWAACTEEREEGREERGDRGRRWRGRRTKEGRAGGGEEIRGEGREEKVEITSEWEEVKRRGRGERRKRREREEKESGGRGGGRGRSRGGRNSQTSVIRRKGISQIVTTYFSPLLYWKPFCSLLHLL